MRTLLAAATLAVLMGSGGCSTPYKVHSPDAAALGTGGRASDGGGHDSHRGGTGGSVPWAGAGGVAGRRSGADGATDARAGGLDLPLGSPDAEPVDGASTGGASTGGSTASATGGSMSAGGAGGATTTSPRNPLPKFVGNSTTEGGGTVRADFLDYWNQLSTGPVGQWGAVRTGYLQYDWSRLDPLYEFTRTHHIPLHEYSFIHQVAEPRFFTTQEEARVAVEDWIKSFCARYPDTELINVVLEPRVKPYYGDAIGGAGASGYDWIVQSFVWARRYCPRSVLLLTDYNIIEYATDNQAFIKLVDAVLAAGAPVDAIGAEGADAARVSTKTVTAYIDKLAATGLPIYITGYGVGEADDAEQEAILKEQFPLFWNDERIGGITFWGYVVGQTWRPNLGLISSDGVPRPAMTWLLSYLGRT